MEILGGKEDCEEDFGTEGGEVEDEWGVEGEELILNGFVISVDISHWVAVDTVFLFFVAIEAKDDGARLIDALTFDLATK